MTWNRIVSGVLAVAAAGALGALVCACGSGGSGGGTGLTAALSRVADTSNTRSQIYYDDTAALVELAGKRLAGTGYAPLRGLGAGGLQSAIPELQSQADINVFDEQYAISTGTPPAVVGVLAGGQNAAQVTKDLTKQGWKRHGSQLVMLPLNLSNSLAGATAGTIARVQPSGSDVIYGMQAASLSQAGSPPGKTLAQNPLISALANCLGHVVAAGIFSNYTGPPQKPAAVAVGVTSPASNASVPHAVACVAWPSSGAASRYAANLRKALSGGSSLTLNERWSALLSHASVTSIGGSQNVVEWQAQTPGSALAVFNMIDREDLPALPDCTHVPPAAQAHIIGCG
jgi:hypothetical protein